MSQPTPSFVTQVQRPEKQQQQGIVTNTNQGHPVTVIQDDNDGGCCSCLFGSKRKNQNNRLNVDNGSQQSLNISKIPINNDNQVDRDQVGLNSPRLSDRKAQATHNSNTNKISLLGPQKPGREGRKCLVLDLDETLVHSSFQPVARYDFLIPVEIDGNVYQVYVAKRPFVDEFLKKMGEVYEVVVFTASLSKYADPVLDLLDIHKVIDYRLFREHCTYLNDTYIKDMSIVGRPIESVFIIDNSPHAYSMQPENAMPCNSWFDDYEDNELLGFIPILQKLADPSVTNIITELERLKLNGCGRLESQYSTTGDDTESTQK